MNKNTEKPPRQWAAEIAAIGELKKRREKLQEVPMYYRPMVETHLKNIWNWKAHNAVK